SRPSLLIGVEAVFGPFDFSPFRSFRDKKLLNNIANAFLEENRFAAPSYFGLTAETLHTKMVGIDDPVHYDANVNAYLRSRREKQAVRNEILALQQKLVEKKRLLNPDLALFDRKRSQQLDGSLGLADYVSYLALTHVRFGRGGAPDFEGVVQQ